jgi:hypothetical protein
MGLTPSGDNNTLGIFLNCSNNHYLLRVIYGSHFSTSSHTFDIKLCTNISLSKIASCKKEYRQNAPGMPNFLNNFLP